MEKTDSFQNCVRKTGQKKSKAIPKKSPICKSRKWPAGVSSVKTLT